MNTTMVWFRDNFEPDRVHGGIMIDGKAIICGCCGGVLDMEDIAEWGYLSWVNLEETILGDLGD